MNGRIAGFSANKENERRKTEAVGVTVMQRCGLRARCTRYKKSDDFDLVFEDGTDAERTHSLQWSGFLEGHCPYPGAGRSYDGRLKGDFYGYDIRKYAFDADGGVYYECLEPVSGERYILTPGMILERQGVRTVF